MESVLERVRAVRRGLRVALLVRRQVADGGCGVAGCGREACVRAVGVQCCVDGRLGLQGGAEDTRGRRRTRRNSTGSDGHVRWRHLVHLVQLVQGFHKPLGEPLLLIGDAPVVEVLARGGSGDHTVTVLDDEPL